MDILFFSITTIGPTFIVILTGALLRKWGVLDADLSGQLSRLVFYLLLPALVIKTLSAMDRNGSFTLPLIMALLLFFLATALSAWLITILLRVPRGKRGFFMAGATFGNNAIIGYAFGSALYGEAGIARAAVLSAVLMPVSIMSAGFMLTPPEEGRKKRETTLVFAKSMIKNPVMISLFIGIALWLIPVKLPSMIQDSLGMLAQAALPLALLSVGGSLEFQMKNSERLEVSLVAFIKLIIMPLSALAASLFFKLSPAVTGSILLMSACPTSISFFVMARNQGHSPSKGAAIVTVTTLVSALSAAFIAGYLKVRGWV